MIERDLQEIKRKITIIIIIIIKIIKYEIPIFSNISGTSFACTDKFRPLFRLVFYFF